MPFCDRKDLDVSLPGLWLRVLLGSVTLNCFLASFLSLWWGVMTQLNRDGVKVGFSKVLP